MSHLEPRSNHDAPGNRGEAGLGGLASLLGASRTGRLRKAAGTARGAWSQPRVRSDGTPGAPHRSSPAREPGAGGCAAGDQQEAGLPPTPETYLPPRQASGTRCALDALPARPGPLPGGRTPRSPPRCDLPAKFAASGRNRRHRGGTGGRVPAPGQQGVKGDCLG